MKYRNCHMAMHLTGNRGAGSHDSRYAHLRNQPPPESGEMEENELQEYIMAAIRKRESAGIRRHYSINFLPAARHSDINYCLDSLVEKGFLRVTREYRCSTCSNKFFSNAASLSVSCCNSPKHRMTSEFFSL